MNSKWELSKSDNEIIDYCKSKNYPIFLSRELVGGNIYIITIDGHDLPFKNDVNYIAGGALRILKTSIKQILQMQYIGAL